MCQAKAKLMCLNPLTETLIIRCLSGGEGWEGRNSDNQVFFETGRIKRRGGCEGVRAVTSDNQVFEQ